MTSGPQLPRKSSWGRSSELTLGDPKDISQRGFIRDLMQKESLEPKDWEMFSCV